MAVLVLESGVYETDPDTAAAVRSIRVPTSVDPGWRPPTVDEARQRFPNAEFTQVTVERTDGDSVAPAAPGAEAASDSDVLSSLFGSVVFDRPFTGVPADPDPDDEDN